MRAWKIAQSQILRALRLNYFTIFIFCARTFKICAPDAMFLNFARLRARSEKVAQPRSRLRDTNFPVWVEVGSINQGEKLHGNPSQKLIRPCLKGTSMHS